LKKLILSFIFVSLFSLAFVSANIQTLGTFKQGDCIELIQTCSNCSYVNISSVLYPNLSIILSDVSMTQQGTKYNYSFCNTEITGKYIVTGLGDLDGETEIWNYDFNVNLMGEELTQSKAIIYFILLIASLLIFGLTLWGAYIFPFKNKRDTEGYLIDINDLKYLKIAMWVFSYLEFLFIIFLMKNISGGFLSAGGFYEFFNILFTILLILLLPFFPTLIFFTIVTWLNDRKLEESIKRGLPV
jgi:hypothetical protein